MATSNAGQRKAVEKRISWQWTILSLAVVGGLLFTGAADRLLSLETIESEFGSGRALRAAGMVDRGWVPGWIPDDAVQVREIHNVDNNLSGLAFRIATGSTVRLPNACLRNPAHGFAKARFNRVWLDISVGHFDQYTCPVERPLRGETDKFRAVAVERGGGRVVSWTFRATD